MILNKLVKINFKRKFQITIVMFNFKEIFILRFYFLLLIYYNDINAVFFTLASQLAKVRPFTFRINRINLKRLLIFVIAGGGYFNIKIYFKRF